jgi:archaemetzincin
VGVPRWPAALAFVLLACSRASAPVTASRSIDLPIPAPSSIDAGSPGSSATPIDAGTLDAGRGHALVVHLVPLGNITDETVAETARGLRTHAPVEVTIEPRHPLPPESRSVIVGRYRAERILEWMERLDQKGGKLMGVTDVDIVTKKGTNDNWGILGLGTLDGRCSVLSTFRMKRTWENGGAPESLVRERLWKTAVHELGHTLGLPHCPNRGCIMEDAHGTVKTTDSETELCPECARRFNEAAGASH